MQINTSTTISDIGILRFNEKLASYTSWGIGGLAKQYYRPSNNAELSVFLAGLSIDEPLVWLGLGSNVLIADDGFAGTVIHTCKMLEQIQLLHQDPEHGITIYVPAGISCAKIARFAAKHSVVGAEFFAGIPGTMGGALAMNAGAWGGETWAHVLKVQVINRQGEIYTRTPAEYAVSYRSVIAPAAEWFLGAQLHFKPGDQQAASAKIKELLSLRAASQPIGVASCGSVFRNPPGKYAAELIDASKLKGMRIGDAEVSSKHANFIVNLGHARASDVKNLIGEIQARVLQDHGVELHTEVKFIGDL